MTRGICEHARHHARSRCHGGARGAPNTCRRRRRRRHMTTISCDGQNVVLSRTTRCTHTHPARHVATRGLTTSPAQLTRSSRVLECPLVRPLAPPRILRRCATVQPGDTSIRTRYHRSRSRCHEISGVDGPQEEKWRKGWTFRRADNCVCGARGFPRCLPSASVLTRPTCNAVMIRYVLPITFPATPDVPMLKPNPTGDPTPSSLS